MNELFKVFAGIIPNYEECHLELFESLSTKIGSERKKNNLGKHFTNNYELYIYAFFLGLYNGKRMPLKEGGKKKNFSYHIEGWGKSKGVDRADFSELRYFIFMAVVAKSNLDLIGLEKDDCDERAIKKEMQTTLEEYTNSGLYIIADILDDNREAFLDPSSFLREIQEIKESSVD